MGKGVKARQPKNRNTNHHDNPNRITKRNGVNRRHHSQPLSRLANGKLESTRTIPSQKAFGGRYPPPSSNQANVKIPFSKHDHVLLVGEGDFSFALSLAQYHKVNRIVATSYDTRDVLEDKYPGVEQTLDRLEGPTSQNELSQMSKETDIDNDEWDGFSSSSPSESGDRFKDSLNDGATKEVAYSTLFYGIDATKLASAHKKVLKQYSPFTKIVFNFPHVGGISTDVNRQVRSNQQLLVGFFTAAMPLLASATNSITSKHSQVISDRYDTSDEEEVEEEEEGTNAAMRYSALTTGYILVTLFEGEPYSLWNIRDLARHCGLKVIESFKFPWTAYPGYKHARTLGEVKSGKDRTDEGKRKGAWRGEERDARCYMLAPKDSHGPYPAAGLGKKRSQLHDGESE